MGIKFVKKTIGDCFDLINGYAFKSNEFISSGNPVIKIKNIKAGYFSEHEFSYVDDNFLITKTEKIVQESDLLISMTGNRHDGTPETWVGKIALFPYKKINNFFLNQRVGALRVKDNAKINPIYASYVLSSWEYQQWFIAIATSSGGQANLSPKQILETEFVFPDKNIQDLIANILSSFDKKITLNRQINQTLEQMAQTLFKSWFVDFDPVIDNALDAGNDIPDTLQERAEQRRLLRAKADFKPLPAETRALFPSEFEESELGWVPKGWEVGSLLELIDIKHGFAFKGEFFTESETPDILLTPGNVKIGGGFKSDKYKYYSGPVPSEYVFDSDDLFVSMTDLSKISDTLGYAARVPFCSQTNFLHNQRLGKVIFKKHPAAKKEFIYQILISDRYRNTVLGSATGTTVKHTSPSKILEHRCCYSLVGRVEQEFDLIVNGLFQRISLNDKNMDVLTKTRDVLLPKLISGELALDALPEAHELVEAR